MNNFQLNEIIEYEENSAVIVTEPLEVVDRVKQIRSSALSPQLQSKVNTLHTVVTDTAQEIVSIVDNLDNE